MFQTSLLHNFFRRAYMLLTFHPLHKLMTSHIHEAKERLSTATTHCRADQVATPVLKWHSHTVTFCFTVRPSSSNPFPLGETFGHPFSPFYAGGAAPNRWPATTSGPASFHSLPPPLLCQSTCALHCKVQLGRSSYLRAATWEGGGCMTLRGPGPPPTLPDSPTLKSPRAQPTRIHKNQIAINHKTATILC